MYSWSEKVFIIPVPLRRKNFFKAAVKYRSLRNIFFPANLSQWIILLLTPSFLI